MDQASGPGLKDSHADSFEGAPAPASGGPTRPARWDVEHSSVARPMSRRPAAGRVATPPRQEIPLPRQPADGAADLAFHGGGEFTVGAEDELLLVDGEGQLLGAAAAPLMATLVGRTPVTGTVSGEIFVDQVELGTPVCPSAEDVSASLAAQRRWLRMNGASLMAVGVHPEAAFGTATMASSSRYDPIVREFAGLFRTPTAAFQVHVGLPDERSALLAYRGLRNRLSVFRALAAGSPYWHGHDSGLASARSAIVGSYPRVNLSPPLSGWEDYVRITERIMAADELRDYTYIWWDLRPQPRLGTLEVRVMDAQLSLASIAGLTALVQGLARHVVEMPDVGDLPDEILAANDRRACRHGVDASVVDVDGVKRPMAQVASRTVAEARAALASDGLDGPLEAVESMLARPSEPQRQRRLCAEQSMPGLLADLMRRTAADG